MIIIDCDFHPSFQQIAMLDTEIRASYVRKQKTDRFPRI
jgi:hypothetical protein